MPNHVVVDGSNLATEGRSTPSLKQLNEAVLSYMSEHPDALITVVVDATFGHRIDATEVAEFDAAVSNNEIVAPPAGAIGRGDAFVLSIANKVNATILSNDSYQEFHGTHTWLFDEGRLVGGKPVPHIGWVFVNRLPVRGPTSRKSVSEAKRGRSPKTVKASPEASQPMPVPAAPPPGATLAKPARARDAAKAAAATKPADVATKPADVAKETAESRAEPTPRSTGTNDLLSFLTFVEHHKPGSSVNAIVENYSSHGAYVRIGDVKGYVPLSLMADPAPRSAREFMKIGESITLVVESFAPARRSIDLAIPTMATIKTPPAEEVVEPKPKRARKSTAKALAAASEPVEVAPIESPKPRKTAAKKTPAATAPKPAPKVRARRTPVDTPPAIEAPVAPIVEVAPAQPAKKRAPRKASVAAMDPPAPPSEPIAAAKPTRRRTKSA
jgi:S1 RNA binding domain/Zc3h12a-like Ribonuclease NYN domain